jgi:hypothetical protein
MVWPERVGTVGFHSRFPAACSPLILHSHPVVLRIGRRVCSEYANHERQSLSVLLSPPRPQRLHATRSIRCLFQRRQDAHPCLDLLFVISDGVVLPELDSSS